MYFDPDSTKNVFQLFAGLKKVPFAMSRHNWLDHDLVVVTKVLPSGKYGTAYGFPVRNGAPNDHFDYASCWKKRMEIPNVGSYQWRLVKVPDFHLTELVQEFYRDIAPKYGFLSLQEEKVREKPWLDPMAGKKEDAG